MKLTQRMFQGFARLLPSFYARMITQKLSYCGDEKGFGYWGGIVVLLTGIHIVLLYPVSLLFESSVMYWSFAGGLVPVYAIALYLIAYFVSDRRAAAVNKALPNALAVMASNMRAGLTPFDAIKRAAIPEFGVLGEELQKATAKAFGSKNFGDYLLEITKRIDSVVLERSLRLLVSSLRSGGKLASLLDGLADDITQRAQLKKDLEVSVRTNMLFIIFIIIVGTPTLLAISIYFIDTVSELDIGQTDTSGLSDISVELTVDGEFLTQTSYVMLLLTALLAGLFLGASVDGDAKRGLRWVPLLVVGSYIVFFVARFFISAILG